MRHFLCPFLSLLLLFSCGSGDNNVNDSESTISGKKVSLEKLDSIQIDYLGNPIVHDLDPINSTVLFMEDKEFSEEILVADFDGNIQARFTKSGDVPDSYGSLLGPLRIGRDNSFLAYGSNGFLTYGFNGELQSRVKLKEFRGSNFTRKSMGFGMEKLGNNFLYIDLGSRDIDYTSINLYKIDGHIIVAYFPGYSVSDRQESFANKSLEEARSFSKRMREKYTSRIAILDSLGNRLNDFVPEGLIARSMLVRNGELWMQEKPDEEVERDYFRLFRVGLKVDGIKINDN